MATSPLAPALADVAGQCHPPPTRRSRWTNWTRWQRKRDGADSEAATRQSAPIGQALAAKQGRTNETEPDGAQPYPIKGRKGLYATKRWPLHKPGA
jgi:hypothetical protein